MSLRYLFTVLLIVIQFSAFADMPYKPLKFELLSSKTEYKLGEILSFTLRITNTDKEHSYPVMIPGKTNSGKKLIYFTAYTIDSTGHATEVACEYMADIPALSGATSGDVEVKQLEPGKYIELKLHFHPSPNYAISPNERHWFDKPLSTGQYHFLAWYQPYGIVPFDLYVYTDVVKHLPQTDKLVINKVGEQSNYCRVIIAHKGDPKISMLKCDIDCKFCKHIKNEQWGKVQQDIEETTQKIKKAQSSSLGVGAECSWLQKHRRVIYLSDPPEAILSSLPSYWGQTIGFNTRKGSVYYNMTFQIGKVYTTRSKLQSLSYLVFPNTQLFKTSTIDYVGLVRFEQK